MPRKSRTTQQSDPARGSTSDEAVFKSVMAASEASVRGDWRRCADSYRQGYARSSPDGQLRYNCISGFTSVLREEHFKASDEDLQFLSSLAKDEGASPMCRAQAAFTRGLMLWLSHEREGAKRNYRKAISIAEGASKKEREHKELFTTMSGLKPTPMGPLLDQLLKETRDNLDILESRAPASFSGEKPGDLPPLTRSKFLLPLGPHGDRSEMEVLGKYFDEDPLSQKCNHCNATPAKLNTCAGCKRAWYCSLECQKLSWPSHKADCRKHGKFQPGDLVKVINAPEELQRKQREAKSFELNGTILEIVKPGLGHDLGSWHVRILGGETTFLLPASSFLFWLAIGQRRALAPTSGGQAQASAPGESPCADAEKMRLAMQQFSQGHSPAQVCERARAEALTAVGPMGRIVGARASVGKWLSAGCPGYPAWCSLSESQRLTMLEDIFQVWVEEHHPVHEKDNLDEDMWIVTTVGDLRPRLSRGARGAFWDLMAMMPGSQPGLLGERLAASAGNLKECLESVEAGLKNQTTDEDAFKFRLSAVLDVGNCACTSLLSHQPGMQPHQKDEAQKQLFETLRELNLATWAMSVCETLASHSVLVEGVRVLIHDLEKRPDLNGQPGYILGRAPKVAGRAPRWRVDVAGSVVAIRSRNLDIR